MKLGFFKTLAVSFRAFILNALEDAAKFKLQPKQSPAASQPNRNMNFINKNIAVIAALFVKHQVVVGPNLSLMGQLLVEGKLAIGTTDFVVAHAFWRASQDLPPIWVNYELNYKESKSPLEILDQAIAHYIARHHLDVSLFDDDLDGKHDWMGNPRFLLPGQRGEAHLLDPRFTN